MNMYLVIYLAFRLMPFLVAAILSIAPLFNHNTRGFVYLFGMVMAVAFTSGMSSLLIPFLSHYWPGLANNQVTPSAVCSAFSLSSDGTKSVVPLELAILGYSAIYLIYSMTVNGLVQNNIVTILFFTASIVGTIYWIYTNSCYGLVACGLSVVISGLLGALWGYIVQQEMPKQQYLFTPSNRQSCYTKNDRTYACHDTDANGSMVTTT